MTGRVTAQFNDGNIIFHESKDTSGKRGKDGHFQTPLPIGRDIDIGGRILNRGSVIDFVNEHLDEVGLEKELYKGRFFGHWGSDVEDPRLRELFHAILKKHGSSDLSPQTQMVNSPLQESQGGESKPQPSVYDCKCVKYREFTRPFLERIFPKDFPLDNEKVTFLVFNFQSRQDPADVKKQVLEMGSIETNYFIPIIIAATGCNLNYGQLNEEIQKCMDGKEYITNKVGDGLCAHFRIAFDGTGNELYDDSEVKRLNNHLTEIGNAITQLKDLGDEKFKEQLAQKMK